MGAIATTRYGKVEGEEADGLNIFRGIPFAAPPVGPLRWLPPQPPASWTGTRSAKSFGPAAAQVPVPEFLAKMFPILLTPGPFAEDCLYLNIWTPGADQKRRPVMIWIHGGAFTGGAGSMPLYDGARLAKRGDVVVVTINYRLGALGLLRLKDVTGGKIPSTGNEALLDQVAALAWVRDNIAAFGGDPGNVTLFGESAGGMSIGCLMAMPAAQGLFHKAIPQSGTVAVQSRERANQAAEWLLGKWDSDGDEAGLRALSVAAIQQPTLGAMLLVPELGFVPYQPNIDGDILPQDPVTRIAAGSAAGVALLLGSTRDEAKLFSALDPSAAKLDEAGLKARLEKMGIPAPDSMIETYRDARRKRDEPIGPGDLFDAIETDRVFRVPGTRIAEAQLAHDPRLYFYRFDWPSPMPGLGACHAIELGFTFGTLDLPGLAPFTGAGAQAEQMSAAMQEAWIAFARAGNPSCAALGDWPRYDEAMRTTMVLSSEPRREFAPMEEERRAWKNVPLTVMGGG